MGIEDQLVAEEPPEPPLGGVTNDPPPPTLQAVNSGPDSSDPARTTHHHPRNRPPAPGPENAAGSGVEAITTAGASNQDVGHAAVAAASAPVALTDAHTVPVDQLARLLESQTKDGLDPAEAARRLARDGPNKVEGAEGVSVWKIFLRQISNSLTIVLVITMVLSFAIDDYIEGGVILAVILLNIVVG